MSGVSLEPQILKDYDILVRFHKIQLLMICEPKQDVSMLDQFNIILKFDCAFSNSCRSLWMFHNSPFVCSIIGQSTQYLSLNVQHHQLPTTYVLSIVHIKCIKSERRELWDSLLMDKPSSELWIVYGNFNVIINPSEKHGRRPFIPF